jgi:DNA (cytosine-5)-methyltransferase 1
MNHLKDKLSLSEQNKIIDKCLIKHLPLFEELKHRGLTYENLRYENYVNGFKRQGQSESIDNVVISEDEIPAISFFSGAGGLDIGFKYAGFKNLISIENNQLFCETLRLNNPESIVLGPPYYKGDLSNFEEVKEILQKKININIGFDGVFHGGPPCQPFSIASNQRFSKKDNNFKRKGFDDEEKGNLLFDYLKFIEYFTPKAFLIENVPGLEELDDSGTLKKHLTRLSNLGYSITNPTILNSADYGVPQNRRRLIIIGILGNSTFRFPEPNLFQSACYDVFERGFNKISNHVTRNHTAESIHRYIKLDYGMRDKLGRVDRLNPFMPSKTVIAGGTKGGGRSHLHPYSPRTLSVRESARLQTFPDVYLFSGSSARQFTQVGNAVPPLLAYKLAKQIKEYL